MSEVFNTYAESKGVEESHHSISTMVITLETKKFHTTILQTHCNSKMVVKFLPVELSE